MNGRYFDKDLHIKAGDNYANSVFVGCRINLDFEMFAGETLTPEAKSVFGGQVVIEKCIITTPAGNRIGCATNSGGWEVQEHCALRGWQNPFRTIMNQPLTFPDREKAEAFMDRQPHLPGALRVYEVLL